MVLLKPSVRLLRSSSAGSAPSPSRSTVTTPVWSKATAYPVRPSAEARTRSPAAPCSAFALPVTVTSPHAWLSLSTAAPSRTAASATSRPASTPRPVLRPRSIEAGPRTTVVERASAFRRRSGRGA
ncbi:hypothetical protein [Streptomyces violaceorubidus]|uniref:Uncharacterized protein n=1 Tax=Streptomyces violaceorubidus TaxID=284042 RepID=A0ABV1T040_9ACTN